ncbi:MAG TPA: 4Fe-4S binding protein [Spirochaetota bacterium]|nr:4Fe-4S binding protein [Spirochaetota bacterium]
MAVKINQEKCTGCGDCVDVCPSEALKVEGDKCQVDVDECTDCEACIDECPEGAISAGD